MSAIAIAKSSARLIPVESDTMEPTLYCRDAVFMVPVDSFQGHGIYGIEVLDHMELYRVQAIAGGYQMSRDNPNYPPCDVTRAQFESFVLGKVSALCKVLDHDLIAA